MYGFKPQHARGKPVQNFADGGLVNPLAGVGEYWSNSNAEFEAQNPNLLQRGVRAINPVTGFGSAVGAMHDGASVGSARDMATAAMQAVPVFGAMRAVAPAVKTVAGAAPAVLVPSMAKTAARGAKGAAAGVAADEAQARGFANGGRVRPRGFVAGKGTGTSDSIPARLSNGEYVLPADTVKAVGVEALDSLRAATHTPVKHEQAKAAHGFFAGGTPGGLDEEKLKNSFGDAAASAANPGVTQVGGLANDGGASANRIAQVPAPIGTQPNRTPEPATPGAPLSVPQPAAQPASTSGGLNAPWWSGEYATAARLSDKSGLELEQQRAAAATPGQAPANDPVKRIVNTGTLSMPQAMTKPADVAPAAPAATSSVAATASTAGGGRGVVNPPLANPSAPAPSAQPEAKTGSEIMPGVFKHGRGQYSDQSTGMGMPAGFTGQPSAQNNAILQRMSDQSQAESMARVSAQQPAGFAPSGMTAPTVRHSGNDWQSRNDLRNAMVSATSIMNDGGKWDKHGKGNVSPERAQYLAMLGTDQALRQSQPGADVAAMRENAGIQREGMQQTGETARTGMREQGANTRDAGRTALARDEFGLKKEAAGFQTRAAKRLEDLQASYQSAKTPEERAGIAQQLRELQAKDAPARYKVAAGGQQIDANGVAYRTPDRIFNEQTGVFSDGAGAAPAPQALPPGMKRQIGTSNGRPVYEDMNGKQVIAKG